MLGLAARHCMDPRRSRSCNNRAASNIQPRHSHHSRGRHRHKGNRDRDSGMPHMGGGTGTADGFSKSAL